MAQLFSQQVRVAVASTTVGTTETSLCGSGEGSLTLEANHCSAGRNTHFELYGQILAALTLTATLRIKIKKGSTVIFDTGTFTIPDALVGSLWRLRGDIAGRSGTSVCVMAAFEVLDTVTSGGAAPAWLAYQSPAYTGGMHDGLTTISASSETIDVTAQWGASTFNTENIVCDAFTLTES